MKLIGRLQHIFAKSTKVEPEASLARMRPPCSSFLVVTGSMRSGTTLLGEMFQPRSGPTNHPDLAFDNDRIGLIRKLAECHRNVSRDLAWMVEDTVRQFRPNADALRLTLNKSDSMNGTLAELVNDFAYEMCNEVMQATKYEGIPKTIGLKTTHLFQEIDFLTYFFAQVKCIILIRDPRDILASNIGRIGRDQPLPVAFMILATLLSYHEYLTTNESRVKTRAIRYEDLITQPVDSIKGILEFADLDSARYNWNYLSVVGSNSSFEKGLGLDIQEGKGIIKTSVGNYRVHLSRMNQYAVERLLEPYMKQFGYLPEIEPDKKLDDYVQNVISLDILAALKKYNISDVAFRKRLTSIQVS